MSYILVNALNIYFLLDGVRLYSEVSYIFHVNVQPKAFVDAVELNYKIV